MDKIKRLLMADIMFWILERKERSEKKVVPWPESCLTARSEVSYRVDNVCKLKVLMLAK